MHSNNSKGARAPPARGFMSLFAIMLALGLGAMAPPAGAQPFAYVANNGSNSVSVIKPATNTVVATVAVGPFPRWGRRHSGWETRLCREFNLQQCFGDQTGHQHRSGHGRGGAFPPLGSP